MDDVDVCTVYLVEFNGEGCAHEASGGRTSDLLPGLTPLFAQASQELYKLEQLILEHRDVPTKQEVCCSTGTAFPVRSEAGWRIFAGDGVRGGQK